MRTRPPSGPTLPPRDRVLAAGARVWADRFGNVPPADERAIVDALERDAPELLTAVNEALFHHGPVVFADAVRRALLRGVPKD